MKTLKERFEEKFIKRSPDECWEWQSSKDRCGYGQIAYGGFVKSAHRVSFALYKSDPDELHVCHSCDNPACVNPNHLFLGTIIDNMNDMKKKGRSRRKISMDQKGIIEDAIRFGYNCSEIARYFKVNHRAIIYIKQRMPEKIAKPYWSRTSLKKQSS